MIVGFIQLSLTLDGVEIGYSVMEQYQGKGIGTQALALAVKIALKISECVYLEILEKIEHLVSLHKEMVFYQKKN